MPNSQKPTQPYSSNRSNYKDLDIKFLILWYEGRLHDDGWCIDISLNGLVGEDATSVNVDLVGNGDIVTENRDVLETCPLSDAGVPTNDGGLDPGVVFNLAALENNAALQTDTVSNNDIWPNSDVWSDAAVAPDLC